MLKIRPNCERCDADLAPASGAMICSFECNFCPQCSASMDATCPNCGGELVPRPMRPAGLLDRYPASTQRVGPKGGS